MASYVDKVSSTGSPPVFKKKKKQAVLHIEPTKLYRTLWIKLITLGKIRNLQEYCMEKLSFLVHEKKLPFLVLT